MESLEFKKLMTGFGDRLRRIEENLLMAVDDEIDDEDKEQAIADGKAKMKEHAQILDLLAKEPVKKGQFVARYDELVESIRASLKKLG